MKTSTILDTSLTSPDINSLPKTDDNKLDYELWTDFSVIYTDMEEATSAKIERTEGCADLFPGGNQWFRVISYTLCFSQFFCVIFIVQFYLISWRFFKYRCMIFARLFCRNISQLAHRVLCTTHNVIPAYASLLEHYPIYIAALDQLAKSNAEFRSQIRYADRPSNQCYIPLNWILLKILHRVIAWRPILTRLVEWQLSEGVNDVNFGPIRVALEKISRFADSTRKQREAIIEFVALLQLEADTATQGLLTQPNRRLLRFGWVERWSERGLSPRMLLLFSDEVLLAHRSQATPFAINVELKLKGLLDGDSYEVTGKRSDAFTLHFGRKSIVLASPDKERWIEAKMTSAVSGSSVVHLGGTVDELQAKDRRRLSPLQVCWHRKTTLGIHQIYDIVTVCQSGYLLRKLRNSNGWQRLWTELTSHTLFFYKTHKDIAPIANLPLLEYKLCMPSLADRVHHSNCFKLVYSTHEYFFRTTGWYSFQRSVNLVFNKQV
ncbi:unnamed protein product [Angiostrongylus costaricensis]|uniref:PH domain-containing protein n=1 Tax=Angiostrongylus costaricensis TaxID=334426 RepID=A0A0R3PWY3_ANGCS|nr:unnamed protein product [Angiostrongylus costaricensis]